MRFALITILMATLLPGVAAASTPAVAPGWPVPGAGGQLFSGPAGGVVEIASDPERVDVLARSAGGRTLWRNRSPVGCGNCDSGPEPILLQPDGTYGPLGATEGGDYWAVDQEGARVTGCTGGVLADGTCIDTLDGDYDNRGYAETRAVRDGATLWSYVEPDFDARIELIHRAYTVVDGAGTAYVALPAGTTAAGATAPARLLALDAATGALRWRVEGGLAIVAPLASGVLVRDGDALAAYAASGVRAWTLGGFSSAYPRSTRIDAARGRAYVVNDRPPGDRAPLAVTAIDTVAGRVLWRTVPADRARLLSVGASGRVYVATERAGFPAVRAISPAGRGIWSRGVAAPATGAAETSAGRVGVAAGGMTLLLDPEQAGRAPRVRRFALGNPRIGACVSDAAARSGVFRASLSPRACPVLRMELPRQARLVVRLLRPRGATAPLRWDVAASRGTAWLRLVVAPRVLRPGPHAVTVSLRGARTPLATFRVTVPRR